MMPLALAPPVGGGKRRCSRSLFGGKWKNDVWVVMTGRDWLFVIYCNRIRDPMKTFVDSDSDTRGVVDTILSANHEPSLPPTHRFSNFPPNNNVNNNVCPLPHLGATPFASVVHHASKEKNCQTVENSSAVPRTVTRRTRTRAHRHVGHSRTRTHARARARRGDGGGCVRFSPAGRVRVTTAATVICA